MSSVIPMLNGEKLLPLPKAPGFYTGNCTPELVSSSKTCNPLSQNEISLTIFEARQNTKTLVMVYFVDE